MSNQSDAPDQKPRTVQGIIHAIEEKCVDGTYLFRGESERHEGDPYYGKVSSALWRKYRGEAEYCDIEAIQIEMLNGAKKHLGHIPQDVRPDFNAVMDLSKESTDDAVNFEILTEIQHYGGATNLIDFTTDYIIALFFACDGSPNNGGRVVIQDTLSIKNILRHPKNPRHRVIAQKSVFLRQPKGFIEPHENDIVVIPAELKHPLLQHLRRYHGISTETIYNDLHGFVKYQNVHEGAYTQYYRGVACYTAGKYVEAMGHYTNAIRANPDFAYAYNNRGAVYSAIGKHDCAIEDLTEAIKLKPNDPGAYRDRGAAYFKKGVYEPAINDFTEAINLNPKDTRGYNMRGTAYNATGEHELATADFSRAIGLNPDDAEAYFGRGLASDRKKDFNSAITDYSQAIQINPDIAEAYANRGEAWLHLKRLGES